jgi:hypothetical protein
MIIRTPALREIKTTTIPIIIDVISLGICRDCIKGWADLSIPKRRPERAVPQAVLFPTRATAMPSKP